MASQFFDSDAESDREEAGTSSERYSEENLKAKHDFESYVAKFTKATRKWMKRCFKKQLEQKENR